MELIPRDGKRLLRLRLRLQLRFWTRLRHALPANGKSLLAHVEHEIEPRGEAVPGLGHSHQKLAAKEAIAPVHRLVRKIELGREEPLLRRLHLDVIMAGAPGVERRQ